MSDFAKTLRDLARLCGKSEYRLAQLSGLDPTFVRRLFDGEKRPSNLTIALVTDPKLARKHPDTVGARKEPTLAAPLLQRCGRPNA